MEELNKILKTGDEVELLLEENMLKVVSSGKIHKLEQLGAAKDVISAGGIFNYARKSGMING